MQQGSDQSNDLIVRKSFVFTIVALVVVFVCADGQNAMLKVSPTLPVSRSARHLQEITPTAAVPSPRHSTPSTNEALPLFPPSPSVASIPPAVNAKQTQWNRMLLLEIVFPILDSLMSMWSPDTVTQEDPTLSPALNTLPSGTITFPPIADSVVRYPPLLGISTTRSTKSPPFLFQEESKTFRLKMHWESHYYWQEDEEETWWCLACTECYELNFSGDGEYCDRVHTCTAGDQVWLQPCEDTHINNGEAFHVINVVGELQQIKISGTNLCLERAFVRYIIVVDCVDAATGAPVPLRQLWHGLRDDGSPFEIRPADDARDAEPFCATQQHHPKNYEVIGLKECRWAHRYDTGYWIQYELSD